MKKEVKGLIPSVKNQALVLDRLAEFYFSGVNDFIELLSEMTGEIGFKELRSTILYLSEFGYIKRSYSGKGNEFFVKITKKGITYYEKIFSPEKKNHIKDGFLKKIKNFGEGIDALKGIATGAVAIFTIFGVSFHGEIMDKFSAKIIHDNQKEINFTEAEALNFLHKKFPKNIEFSCKIKKPGEFSCNFKREKDISKNIKNLHGTFANKKIPSENLILLKKTDDGKIIFLK